MPPDDQYAPSLPEAVRRQVERANEIAREAGIANVPPADGDNSEGNKNPPEDRTVLTPSEGADSAVSEPQPAPGDEIPSEPAAPPPEETWEQRYRTLQGKYSSEVPDLRQQLREQQERIDRLQQQQQQIVNPSAQMPQPQARQVKAREVPPEDVEIYGQDLITAAQRWAEASFAPRLEEMEQRLMHVEGGNARLQEYTTGQQMEVALSRAVPDWEAINVNRDFLAWLAQRDPLSGEVRQNLLADAYGRGDTARTIAFFNAFKNEHTVVSPAPRGTQTVHTDALTASADRLPLESLAVPGRSNLAAPAPLGAPEKRIWSPREIAQFFDQKRRGLWDHRPDDIARIETDIAAAGLEGRVR